ncbi:sucrase-isomaltase, intestinal-like [Helicoverpa zea]|uniref:sucrase-isomaltase, intestinal-like n=1 Tax=Helicoverpa zea TaxID=7113 RepID=UPI001F579C69|nr:sucrase-isomaltase, intestinal-like [Helicoverpa zea]
MIPHVNDYKGDIEDDEIPFAIEQAKNIKWYDWVLLNRPLRVIVALLLTTILGPILIYRFIFFPSLELPPPDGLSIGSCLVPREARIPCGVEAVTPEQCHAQCCYDHHHNLCFHRYPSRFSYMTHHTWAEDVYLNPRIQTTPYGSQRSFRNIKLSIDEVTPTHLTLTFYKHNNITGRKLEEKNYVYGVTHPELNVVVNSTQGNIFNTARGPLIASNNIWEISFKLTNETLYGLGEIPLKPDTVKVIYNHKGASSSIPLIFAKFNGSYHGLLIDTMAPTEVIVRKDKQLVVRSITDLGLKFHLFVGPKPADIMRDAMATIKAKKNLEYWMLGAHVCRESTSTNPLEELRTFLSSASAAAPSTTRMPFESHCGTLSIVFNTECNSTMVSLVDQGATLIKNGGKRFVPHVSPYIKYTALPEPEDEESSKDEDEEEIEEPAVKMETSDRCIDDDKIDHQIIRDPISYKMYKGVVNNHDVIYPSYKVVSNETMQHLWAYNTDFDAVILENNWPLDESEKNFDQINDFLPYFSETFEAAFNFTPQWNATRPTKAVGNFTRLANSTEYPGELYFIRHSEYGNEFANAFENIKGSIPKLSSSQWMNGDIIINRQNIPTSWTNLQRELIEASLGGISGHWYWSSPICGDTEHFLSTTQIRLCAKWYMAATYMPMIKIHSKTISRDPLAFVGTDRIHMITALNRRLSLLPYFYTVLQEGPLLRPMFYQFPSSVNITDLTTQFAVGDDILIVPNLQPSQTHVHVRMPPGTWYEFWSGMEVVGEEGQAVTLTTTEAEFLSLVRGGSIIVMQKNVQLTAELTRRQSPYSLIIALKCETTIDYNATEPTPTEKRSKVRTDPEENAEHETSTESIITTTTDAAIPTITTCNATGKLFMNENMTITLQANSTALTINAVGEDFQVLCNENVAEWASSITKVIIYGLHEKENNYDEKRIVRPTINLCQLVNNEEIIYKFVDIDF